MESDEQNTAAFLTWLVFDCSFEEDERTIADAFVSMRGDSLTPGERTFLDKMRASTLRVYEVFEVRPDEALGLKDLWTNEVVHVRERLGTRQIARWDLLAARVIQGPVGELELDGVPYLLPSSAKESALRELRRHFARLKRELDTDDPNRLFKRVGMLFHHLWLDHVALRPMPTVVTAEGDPLTFARAVFDINDHERAVKALGSHPELEREEDDDYVWVERAPSFNWSLGRISRFRPSVAARLAKRPHSRRCVRGSSTCSRSWRTGWSASSVADDRWRIWGSVGRAEDRAAVTRSLPLVSIDAAGPY